MEYVKSQHNIFGPLADGSGAFLVNLLSQQADILSQEWALEYEQGRFTQESSWIEKGYLVNPAEEKRRFQEAYLQWMDQQDREEVQVFYVPTYQCNFACDYCFQESYQAPEDPGNPEVLGAFFRFLDGHLAGRKKYVTLFGGEPLLSSPQVRRSLEGLVEGLSQRNLELAVVTNGYHLPQVLPLLEKVKVREIQLTLDGLADQHNRRRPLKGGQGTFDQVVQAVDAALAASHNVNLRVVLDRENLQDLVGLTALAQAHQWTSNPHFKTQIGRNYELHTCQTDRNKLYTRVQLYQDLYQLIKAHPQVLEFHRPAFSISKFLWETGKLPSPLFDACPGTKTEWALDSSGRIFACTATVGKKGEELGTFYPQVQWNSEALEPWEDRDITQIPECQTCSLALACGGGCAEVARNQTGRLKAPDCRAVREGIGHGLPLYFS